MDIAQIISMHDTKHAANRILKETDWTQLEDAPFTDSDKNLWKIYRQELRDVPSQIGFPTNIIWPSKPK